MRKVKTVLCCCGSLGLVGLRAVLRLPFVSVVGIMTDSCSTSIQALAGVNGIKVFKGDPRSVRKWPFPAADILFSVNYIYILPGSMLSKPRLMALNIHGSLLPKYMGRTPVTWVIINDEVETGITVHEMTPDVDSGPIVYQEKISIGNNDTGGSLLARMASRYPVILRKVFQQVLDSRILLRPQELEKRTYFGRREATDGCIDWRWSARKVYNWVRAQTRPYPGAFGYVNGRKYRFWRVEEMDARVGRRRPGSSFRKDGALCIVCGWGAVRIIDYEIENG